MNRGAHGSVGIHFARVDLRAMVALGLAALLGAAPAAGQQQAAPQAAERGWLGVGLHEVMECREQALPGPRPCERRLVVAQVAVGSPASRAGVSRGDTLLELDGEPLTDLDPPTRERTFAVLRPGQTVDLRVGRAEGRRTLRVEAARRPASARFRWAPAPPPVRVEAPAVPATPAPAAPPVAAPPGSKAYVVAVRTDSGDVVRIRRWPVLDGAIAATADSFVVLSGELRSVPEVWLELGPEFHALRDSTLRHARVRVDSLRRVFRLEEAARTEAVRSLRSTLVEVRERRLAGAEFSPLSEPLADYFHGVREGLLVLRVLPGTPAERLGLRPGDVVVEAAGRSTPQVADLREALRESDAGAPRIRWIRKGEAMEGTLPRG